MEDKKNPNPQNGENGGETGGNQTAKEPWRKKIQRGWISFRTSKAGKTVCVVTKAGTGVLALWKLVDLIGGKKKPVETPVTQEEEIPEETEIPEENPIEEIDDQME